MRERDVHVARREQKGVISSLNLGLASDGPILLTAAVPGGVSALG